MQLLCKSQRVLQVTGKVIAGNTDAKQDAGQLCSTGLSQPYK